MKSGKTGFLLNRSWQMRTMLVLFLFWLIVFSMGFTSPAAKEQIRWKNPTQLSADDFRKPKAGRKVKVKTGRRTYRILEGFIYSGIAFSYSVNGEKVSYEVYSFMLPDESWLADPGNKATLEHEQAHFNISEIYARKLRGKLSKTRNYLAAKEEYQRIMKELARTQDEFDRDQGGEVGVTQEWQQKISDSLIEYDEFNSSSVVPVKGR